MKLKLKYTKMNKGIVILILLISFIYSRAKSSPVMASDPVTKNAVYFSFGGAGFYYSINYERQFVVGKNYYLGVKGGIGTSFSSVLFPHEFSIPTGIFFLYGKNRSHLDISMNLSGYFLEQYDYFEDRHYKKLSLLFVPSVVYRYQKPGGGFMGRAGISPVINVNKVSNSFTPWIDLSLGWAF